MKIIKYFNQLVAATQYFSTHEWTFHRDNITDMMKKVKTLKDNDIVKLDLRDMDWKKYAANYMMGIKKFILKEDCKPVKVVRQRLSLYV